MSEQSCRGTNHENIVTRVAGLPFVNSAYQLLSTMYMDVKKTNPLVKSAFGLAERGMKRVAEEAVKTVAPMIQRLEPQFEIVNNYALSKLDQLEEKYAFLNQPADEVASDLKEFLVASLDDFQHLVRDGIDNVKFKTTMAMEDTKTVLIAQATTFINTTAGQTLMFGIEIALSQSESFIDKYLSVLGETSAENYNIHPTDEDAGRQPSYYRRLEMISTKLSLFSYQWIVAYGRGTWEQAMHVILRILEVAVELKRKALELLYYMVQTASTTRPMTYFIFMSNYAVNQVYGMTVILKDITEIVLEVVINNTSLYYLINPRNEREESSRKRMYIMEQSIRSGQERKALPEGAKERRRSHEDVVRGGDTFKEISRVKALSERATERRQSHEGLLTDKDIFKEAFAVKSSGRRMEETESMHLHEGSLKESIKVNVSAKKLKDTQEITSAGHAVKSVYIRKSLSKQMEDPKTENALSMKERVKRYSKEIPADYQMEDITLSLRPTPVFAGKRYLHMDVKTDHEETTFPLVKEDEDPPTHKVNDDETSQSCASSRRKETPAS
ncbi:uncharacterized protein LOC122808904 [Protopterus annectens]|uniref:uncharacterized protein LOC122808904 n=1 Tax=Protopterus annectens TaxID=7888 RepID=UPI001CF93E16|nr:uncharacterized protein LOC122808904 [Protopterus annectens]XP_043935956.1 uncharacterized protein LOC122808904 [Protopterus annectens]